MPGNILLLENDPIALHALRATLEYGGFETGAAFSSDEALQLLASQQFAAMLISLEFVDRDAYRLIQNVRQRSEIPILVMSRLADEKTRIALLDWGADDFVANPYLPGELLARVRSLIRRAGLPSASSSQSLFVFGVPPLDGREAVQLPQGA